MILTSKLDPLDRVDAYLKLHEKYLKETEELYAKGDLQQAGEKYWGAVTALLSAVAEKRGLPHHSHRDYAEIIELLHEERGDAELPRLFASAERLHANFYHGFLKMPSFEIHRRDALKLVEKLKLLL
ncbi:MAG: PaREP1 family protein [Thermofilum sp.]|uniref:PaREP1 family protein n=1 Tax=Pyrobaculum sp. TaxID=2004705 RepID=UPI0031809B98